MASLLIATPAGISRASARFRRAPGSHDQPDQLANFLLGSEELRGAVIFPTGDVDIFFIDRFRVQLEPHFRLAIPPRHASVALSSAEKFAGVDREVGFPCLVKLISSVHWYVPLGRQKAVRADGPAELQAVYSRVAAMHPEILVQEWIPGAADQLMIVGGYFTGSSEPLAYFTARKIIQSPDDFGTGCLVESCDIPELVEPTLRLWRALSDRRTRAMDQDLPRLGWIAVPRGFPSGLELCPHWKRLQRRSENWKEYATSICSVKNRIGIFRRI